MAELDWLLENLTKSVDGVRYAVVLSPDGLTLGRSPEVTPEVAEHLSALVAGLQSLARGAGQRFGYGEVSQTIVEMDAALLFITPAGAPLSRCWPRRRRTRARSPTRWRCSSSASAST